jgi:hypothetical protein
MDSFWALFSGRQPDDKKKGLVKCSKREEREAEFSAFRKDIIKAFEILIKKIPEEDRAETVRELQEIFKP